MNQMEKEENAVPTMEDLAGTNIIDQIETAEVMANEEARMSNRNRTGASLRINPKNEERK